ncbi:juvenile hormone epoxide hydrolase-like isoform X3 [Leguminivora glycinivorella]|uniref:juvenile hormone epoxide hydrolase-like isoform X3 n=1 Tax=Leguminivora glycinivorella TaxID=1035111 RepID=UPI00200C3D2F|nr:juvenile hormone epoxide hydrolase-like isoform X3 [Leguminivora glycinivorella]
MVGYILLLRTPPPLPNIDINAWWGPGNETKQDTSIRPFEVQFSDMMIQDLKKRLKKHRIWTPPLETIDFQYGFNTDQLDSWVSYWAEKYNFKGREKFFNKFPHYKTNIQGLDIHFIRVQPEAPARSGLGTAEMAVVLRNLMHRLGFKKFYLQGGDIIGISLATLFPQEVLGFHSNVGASASISAILLNLIGAWLPSFVVEPHLAHRMYPLSSTFGFLLEESGYVHLQATKPDTLGLAISDSPIGLLAYILEKFSTWTKSEYKHLPDGGLDKHWSRDQLLDNLMCYWATNSFTTSVRMYAEIFSLRQIGLQMDEIPTPVPTWIIQAKNELIFQPWRILRIKFPNLIHTNAIEDGGHFLAFQLPKVFSEDVLKAVSAFRKQKKENTEL